MNYAIISLGGKQYRVQEGERLLVDRLPHREGKTFHPNVLLVGGDGKVEFAPKGVEVTAKVVGEALGDKIRIGKYRPKSGYKRHAGHRSRLSHVEIASIGKKGAARKVEEKPKSEPKKAESKPKAEARTKPEAKTKPASKPKAAPKGETRTTAKPSTTTARKETK